MMEEERGNYQRRQPSRADGGVKTLFVMRAEPYWWLGEPRQSTPPCFGAEAELNGLMEIAVARRIENATKLLFLCTRRIGSLPAVKIIFSTIQRTSSMF